MCQSQGGKAIPSEQTEPAPLRRLWTFVRPYRWRLAMAVAALLVTSASLLAIPKAVGTLMDAAFAAGDRGALDATLRLMALLVVSLAGGMALRTYLVTWVGERVVADIRARVYDHLLALPMGFFDARRIGEILSRLTSDVAVLQSSVGVVLLIALRSSIQLAGSVVLMVMINFQLSAMVLLVVPLVVLVAKLLGRRVKRHARTTQDRQADIANQIEQSLNAIATVKAHAAEAGERRRLHADIEAGFAAARTMLGARAALTFTMVGLAFGSIVVVSGIGGRMVLDGGLSGGMLTQFVLYTVFSGFAVSGLSEVLGESRKAMGASERLFQLLDEPPENAAPASPAALPPGPGAIVFENIRFAYPARPGQPVLDGFSLTIAAGETVALVGASGAGKSTLFRLLLRFYEPDAGRILLDGADIAGLDPQALRRQFAVVPQEPVIFAGNALDNIRYARPEASEAEVIEAARVAQADDFLRRLPRGYQTPLGDKGQHLSAGQRQRIAIARAVLLAPRVLLMDEPTSSVDRENERLIQQALAPFAGTRTTLAIAHRLATVRAAGRVVFVDGGTIAAQGTHQQLMTSSRAYARLVDLEFAAPPAAS